MLTQLFSIFFHKTTYMVFHRKFSQPQRQHNTTSKQPQHSSWVGHESEMEYCASAASMLAEEIWQIAEGFVEVPVNLN